MKVTWIIFSIIPLGFIQFVLAVDKKSKCQTEIKFGPESSGCVQKNQEIWSYRGGDLCHNWYYAGCKKIINNNFTSAKACHDACVATGVEFASREAHNCVTPKIFPPPNSINTCPSKTVWSYDSKIKECTGWIFTGCVRGGNIYDSYGDCQSHCIKAVTTVHWLKEKEECVRVVQPVKPDPKCALHRAWTYDSVENKCHAKEFQSCTLPKDTFRSIRSCQDTCVATEEWQAPIRFMALCELPLDPVPKKTKCAQGTTLYSYDHINDDCVQWKYLGCEIVGNYYPTHNECLKGCVRKYGVTRNYD